MIKLYSRGNIIYLLSFIGGLLHNFSESHPESMHIYNIIEIGSVLRHNM